MRRIEAVIKNTAHFLVESDLIIGLLAYSFLIVTKIIFFDYLFFSGADVFIICSSLFAYKLTRLFSANNISRSNFTGMLLLILIIIFSSLFLTKTQILLFIPAFVLWFIYFIPSVNKSFQFKLRDNAILKITVISFVWTWITLIIPVAGTEIAGNILFLHFIARFFFIAAISIANDLADVKQDKINGTYTLPVIVGRNTTFHIIITCLLLFLVFAEFQGYLSPLLKIAHLATAIASALLIFYAFKCKEKSLCKLVVDSTVVCQFIIISGLYYFS